MVLLYIQPKDIHKRRIVNITTKAEGISMKIQKRVVALGVTGLMMVSLAPGAGALGVKTELIVPSNVEIIREDVS